MKNWLIWVVWVLKIALNLIGNMNRLKKEVPEAWKSIQEAKKEILDSLSGGLTADEIELIKLKLEKAWDEIEDVVEILGTVIPTGIRLR